MSLPTTLPTTRIQRTFSELSVDQLYDLLKLRSDIFIVEQDCAYQDLDEKDRHPESIHLMLYKESLQAYIRLLAPDVSYAGCASIGRVVTAKSARGQGFAGELIRVGIALCEQTWSQSDIKISAQSYLLEFYCQLGFTAIGDPYLEDNIPHQAMIRPG